MGMSFKQKLTNFNIIKSRPTRTAFIALGVALLLTLLDQYTKYLVIERIKPLRSLNILSAGDLQLLNFTYLENTGAAFSSFEGMRPFLIIVVLIFVITALFLLITGRVKQNLTVWAVSLTVAGGLGNLIDRVANGFVVDFIDLRFIHFAVFNVADMCAVTGALLLLFSILREEWRLHKKPKTNIDNE